jgi:two-component system CheB/CheR fusion protein
VVQRATSEEPEADEALQAMNKEYRPTSEEPKASTEELRSVNTELRLNLEAVSRANSDLENLMAAVDFATLLLDPLLRIRRFTSRVTDFFGITAGDEGRPITEFSHQFEYDALASDIRSVLNSLKPLEREIYGRNECWYLMRMRAYPTMGDKAEGVVITFVDITERRRVEQALRDREAELNQKQLLIELSREPIFVWDFDNGIVEWNRGSEELYGFTRDEALGQRKDRLLRTSSPGSSFEGVKQRLLESGNWSGELIHHAKDGRELTVESRIELRPLAGRRLVLETTRDITERKEWERRQKMLLAELTHRVKNTLAIVQAIAHQTLNTSKSREDFVRSLDGRLLALAAAHTLLVESNWRGAELGALARHELAPLISGDVHRLRIEGEPLLLPPDLATPFGLVLHELATNATKYGALSNSKGTVSLSWNLNDADQSKRLTMTWQEHGGPPVVTPKLPGFGTSLIDRAIPGARVQHEFDPAGIVCRIDLPFPEKENAVAASPGS